MKKEICLALGLCLSLTVNAHIYSWDYPPSLLTELDPEPYADFMAMSLTHPDLNEADLRYANMQSVFLDAAYLNGANLSYANLSHADLGYSLLKEALFIEADLTYANLISCDFRSADLVGAFLQYADLGYAMFNGADLCGANISDTLNWSRCNFNTALYNAETILPVGLDPDEEGMIYIPEPATLFMLGFGNIAFYLKRKR